MASYFYLKVGDRQPSIEASLTRDGVSFTGATSVLFEMKLQGAATVKSGAGVIVSNTGSVLTVRYDWAAGDTGTAGIYDSEWVVTIGGKEMTIPADSYSLIKITARAV